jgi:hypothetical protein
VNLRFAYLDEHSEAIPTLARSHHEAWHAVTPKLRVVDRMAGFTARSTRFDSAGLCGVLDNFVVGTACLV